MVELLVEILIEFLINIVGELFFDVGIVAVKESLRPNETDNPLLALIGYALLGLLAGGLSILAFPQHKIPVGKYHGIGLLIIPLLAGLVMAGIGALKRKAGRATIRLDTFSYGFVFALCMTLIRFRYAN